MITSITMKKERKMYIFQLLIHTSLSISIALAGIVAFFVSQRPDGYSYTSQPFFLALFNVVLLILVLIAVSILVNKFFLKLASSSPHTDELTGFMTRQAFMDYFEQILYDAKQSAKPVSILLIDIDHFRLVNEKYGHRIADKLLINLSNAIQYVLRGSDITCRWGGDQMLVALKDCTEKDACWIAKNIIKELNQQTLDNQGEAVSITASIGVAQMVKGDDAKSLIIRAETGLCSARDNGRNTYAIGYEWILIDYYIAPIF